MPDAPDSPSSALDRDRKRAADMDLALADELGYLRTCLEVAAATPEAFDLAVLLPRVSRAVDALEAVLELADGAEVTGKTGCACPDCTIARRLRLGGTHGLQACMWNLDPAKVREAITTALTGEEAGHGN